MERLRGTVARGQKRSWLLVGLLAGVILLAVAGLALLGAYFYLQRQPTVETGWMNPLTLVRSEAIAPDLAALSLAGEADDRVVRAALEAGEVETAFATLAYSTLMPDTLRSGNWLLLADRYRAADAPRATACYALALDIATLGASLGDVARADISLQVARGLAGLERKNAAQLALAQAENIARYSLSALPAQRRDLLTQVAAAYASLGQAQTAAAVRRDLEAASAGPGVRVEPPPSLLPQMRGRVTLAPELTAAIAARQRAAATLAARWLQAAPSSRTSLADALTQALLAEDAARTAFYSSATALTPADQLALGHDQVVWLTLKYRAAQGAYGGGLAPAWQAEAEAIRNELVAAYTDLINGYGRQLDALAPAEAGQARVELLRQGLLWTRLGLFPDGAEEPLRAQLTEAAQQLWTRQGSAGLTVVVQETPGWRLYLLSGAEPAKPTPVSK
jgi:hypothetical protein